MLEELRLVEVKSEHFSAIVPAFETRDALEAFVIIEKFIGNDTQGAFEKALEMFIDALADDKKDELYQTPHQEIIALVADWIGSK